MNCSKNFTKEITFLVFLTLFFHSFSQTGELSAKSFQDSISKPGIQLLDVRTSDEYNQGHISGAFQADWNNFEQFKERTASLDKHQPLYVYCLAGSRSAAAQKWLLKQGFEKVYNLHGGINAWNLDDLPLEGKKEVKQVTAEEFLNTLPKDRVVLVDIGAEWCPPCKKMSPLVKELEADHHVIYVDGGTQTELVKALHAEAFPTFISFKNGKEYKRITGVCSKKALEELLN